jgi:hypothetical protein
MREKGVRDEGVREERMAARKIPCWCGGAAD